MPASLTMAFTQSFEHSKTPASSMPPTCGHVAAAGAASSSSSIPASIAFISGESQSSSSSSSSTRLSHVSTRSRPPLTMTLPPGPGAAMTDDPKVSHESLQTSKCSKSAEWILGLCNAAHRGNNKRAPPGGASAIAPQTSASAAGMDVAVDSTSGGCGVAADGVCGSAIERGSVARAGRTAPGRRACAARALTSRAAARMFCPASRALRQRRYPESAARRRARPLTRGAWCRAWVCELGALDGNKEGAAYKAARPRARNIHVVAAAATRPVCRNLNVAVEVAATCPRTTSDDTNESPGAANARLRRRGGARVATGRRRRARRRAQVRAARAGRAANVFESRRRRAARAGRADTLRAHPASATCAAREILCAFVRAPPGHARLDPRARERAQVGARRGLLAGGFSPARPGRVRGRRVVVLRGGPVVAAARRRLDQFSCTGGVRLRDNKNWVVATPSLRPADDPCCSRGVDATRTGRLHTGARDLCLFQVWQRQNDAPLHLALRDPLRVARGGDARGDALAAARRSIGSSARRPGVARPPPRRAAGRDRGDGRRFLAAALPRPEFSPPPLVLDVVRRHAREPGRVVVRRELRVSVGRLRERRRRVGPRRRPRLPPQLRRRDRPGLWVHGVLRGPARRGAQRDAAQAAALRGRAVVEALYRRRAVVGNSCV
mmetsp:Transcript_21870/g.67349  ORF Transcript_21870/g.67349 Transcript_21870/m.67349 type:complete len:668 (+) Transcript_21870:706-2709(+)